MAARRALDRLLLLAIAVSLLAAVLERHAREGLATAPIPSFPVDLATDPPERLRLLPGLGPTRVAALLSERERAGAPSTWTDLERVRGIGGKTLEGWRASGAMLGPAATGPPPDAHPPFPAPSPAPSPEAPPSGAPTSEARVPRAYAPAAPAPAPEPQAAHRSKEGGAPPDPHAR